MADTPNKKEKQKKKAKAKQDKAEKMKERKTNNSKGKSLEDMLAYVDENGDLSSTPPNPAMKKAVRAEDINIGVPVRVEEEVEVVRKGTVTFYNDAKGYGFIADSKTKESIFVHVNQLLQPIKEGNTVSFETERNAKGLNAIKVTKI